MSGPAARWSAWSGLARLRRLARCGLAPCLCAVGLAAGCARPRPPLEEPAAPASTSAQTPAVPATTAAGEAAPADPVRTPRPWDAATAWRSSAGSYLVRFRSDPEPMPDNEPFAIDVWVFDPDWPDRPLGDVELSVDADMPQHGHGMSLRPRVERGPDGRFHVTGMLLHMTGEWQVYFDVTRGAVTERAQYPIVLE